MAKPYDAGARVLIEQYLPDWLALASRKAQGPVRVIDSDLSTITAEADKLLFIEDPQPWILHLEPQANWDGKFEERISWYNTVGYKHECLVHSVIVLLRRAADSPRLTGEFLQAFPGDPPYRTFRYQVVRVWQLAADALASGGWGLFPLAPLCDDAEPQLPSLMERMAKRLQTEVAHPQKSILWQATAILSNLRYKPDLIVPLMRKGMSMITAEDLKPFNDYVMGMGILESLIDLGEKRFGAPDAKTLDALRSITELEPLRQMRHRLLDVNSWQELLEAH